MTLREFRYFEGEAVALVHEPEFIQGMLDVVRPYVERAQQEAPKLSGQGSLSIRAEAVLDGPELTVEVTWDRLHWYMYMHERGTVRMPARPFMVPALEGR